MSAGEKAIAKEMRRQEKERRKRIELANKMLIPVSKKTAHSLGMISFDPDGVFYLEDMRWIKIFTLEGNPNLLLDVVNELSGRIRITMHIKGEGGSICHLTLMETGEIYEEVRQRMMQDEAVIRSVVSIHPYSVDEAMNEIAGNFYQDIRFSYASYVRGNKDWKKEVFFEVNEEREAFIAEGMYGESFIALSFPKEGRKGILHQLENIGCSMYVSFDLNSLTKEEHSDYKRAVEKKYNRRLPIVSEESFINLSLSIVILCDSKDARNIIEETVTSVCLGHGVLLAPSFHRQGVVAESVMSFGLRENKIMRNVSIEVAKQMMGGESDADAKIQV